MFSCQLEEPESEGTISISIKSTRDLTLSSDSEIIFNIYGYDINIADAPATLLKTYTFPINTVPSNFEFDYTDSWDDNIDPNTGSSSDFKYYLVLGSDNNDSTVLVTDYETTNDGNGPRFVDHLSELSQTIYIKYYE